MAYCMCVQSQYETRNLSVSSPKNGMHAEVVATKNTGQQDVEGDSKEEGLAGNAGSILGST